MELVDPLEVLGLAEDHQIRVAAGPYERERAQQVTVGEVLARSNELALVRGALLVVTPAPRRVDLKERVLDEATRGHQVDDTQGVRRSRASARPAHQRHERLTTITPCASPCYRRTRGLIRAALHGTSTRSPTASSPTVTRCGCWRHSFRRERS